MKSDEIKQLLMDVAKPISHIENDIGIPSTVLQKAIKGKRPLPKKWGIKLREYVVGKRYISAKIDFKVADLSALANQSNYSIDTTKKSIPPMPERKDFEDNWAFLEAKNEWKLKYNQSSC